jgi:omega-6 fatty acid desaturase (delta-12 desaturase)
MKGQLQNGEIPDLIAGQRGNETATWKKIVAKYQQPSRWRSTWQIFNSLVPYLALWYLIYLSLAVSWWIALPLAILAGGFLVRLFIIHHDCGHSITCGRQKQT